MSNHTESLSLTKKDSRRRPQTPSKSRKGTLSEDVASVSSVHPPPFSPSKAKNKHNVDKAMKSPKSPNKKKQGAKTSTNDKDLGPSMASLAKSLAEIRGSRRTHTSSPARQRAHSLTTQSPRTTSKKISTPRAETKLTEKRVYLPTSPKAHKLKSPKESKKKRAATPMRVSPRKADRTRDPIVRDTCKREAPSPKPSSPERKQSHRKRSKTPQRRRGTLPSQLPLTGTGRPLVGILKPSSYPRGPVASSIENDVEDIRGKRRSYLKLALSERVRVDQKGKSSDIAPIAAAINQVDREGKYETSVRSTPTAFRKTAYPQSKLLAEDEEEDYHPVGLLNYVVHLHTPKVFRAQEDDDDIQGEGDYQSAETDDYNGELYESLADDSCCNACGFQACYVPEGMVPCLRCKQVGYCSVECLQWDLTSGDHANVCVEIG